MWKGIILSLALHAIILVIFYHGLPSLTSKRVVSSEKVVTVDLLPVKSEQSKPPKSKLPQQKKRKEKKIPPKPKPKMKPTPTKPLAKPEKKPEAIKPPKKPELNIKPAKKPEAQKEEKNQKSDFSSVLKSIDTQKEEKNQKSDFSSVLKSIDTQKEKESLIDSIEKSLDQLSKKNIKTNNKSFDSSKPLSISEIDAVVQEISKCWIIPAGAQDAHNTVVPIRITLNPDGSVANTLIIEQDRYNNDNFYRAAADSAVRAVLKCSPLKTLPPNKYNTWQVIEINFDPRDLVY